MQKKLNLWNFPSEALILIRSFLKIYYWCIYIVSKLKVRKYLIWDYLNIYTLKYQACLAVQHWDIRTVLEKKKKFPFMQYYLKSATSNFVWNEYKGNLPSNRGFLICNSHFNESCFERDLKIIVLVLLCLFKFYNPFSKIEHFDLLWNCSWQKCLVIKTLPMLQVAYKAKYI